jgi:hypothetical protein
VRQPDGKRAYRIEMDSEGVAIHDDGGIRFTPATIDLDALIEAVELLKDASQPGRRAAQQ